MKAAEARAAMLQAGRELWIERTTSADPVGVDFMAAVNRSGIPRSTAYRLFTDGPGSAQRNYTMALLTALVGEASRIVRPMLGLETHEGTDLSTIDSLESAGLSDLGQQVVRRTVADEAAQAAGSRNFWLNVGAIAVAAEVDEEAGEALREALRSGGGTPSFIVLYRDLADAFGARLRAGWTWDRLDQAATAIIHGAALQSHLRPDDMIMHRATGPSGEAQEWNLAAVMMEGLLLMAFESNPRMVTAIDFSRWLSLGSAS